MRNKDYDWRTVISALRSYYKKLSTPSVDHSADVVHNFQESEEQTLHLQDVHLADNL